MTERVKRKRLPLSDDSLKKRRMNDRERNKTRICLGRAFAEWRELKEKEKWKTDADLALFLLHVYKSWKTTPSPSKGHNGPPQSPVSSITEDSDSDRDQKVAILEPDVQTLLGVVKVEVEEAGPLDSSMHSLSIVKEHDDSPDEGEANDLRKTIIDPDRLGLEDEHSSDEDYVPSIHLRTDKTHKLQKISVDEAVLDFEGTDPPEPLSVPEKQRVLSEEDLVGKHANITYNDNLLALAMYLRLPIQKCDHVDKLSGVACPGIPPFRVTLTPRGTGVVLEWLCPFGHPLWSWNSQPTLKFGMQGGDFMLSMNILLSGNSYRKVALLFKFMAMGIVTESTYFRIQDAYCVEPVQEFWENTRSDNLEHLGQKDHDVILGEDRMNFPGHCAQFCTCTTPERDSKETPFIQKTRALLAAIDYNQHNGRLPARNRAGHKMYKRSYKKNSKSWSVYPIKEKKQYTYIPDLQKAILSRRLKSRTGLPRKLTPRHDNPRRLGLLAGGKTPSTA